MLEILAYAIGIMYTPGPCNLLSLNAGLNRQTATGIRFCFGVACAMLFLFLLIGYTGSWLIDSSYQVWISGIGSFYIAYLALSIMISAFKSGVTVASQQEQKIAKPLDFKTGLFMQLLNPKSFVAIIPIVTVQFPAAQISGSLIFVWALLLSILAFGAPGSYLYMGARLSKWILNPYYFRGLSLVMALLLLYVSIDIAYSHVYANWAVSAWQVK